MGLPYCPCGNYEPHEPHDFGVLGERGCPGWTTGDQTARQVTVALTTWLRENVPFYPRQPLPAGLWLEVHASVLHVLMRSGALALDGTLTSESMLGIRWRVNQGLPAGHWRLVIVTEDVRLRGSASGVTAGVTPPQASILPDNSLPC